MRATKTESVSDSYTKEHLAYDDLIAWFTSTGKPRRLIGLEVEYGLVRADTGRSVSYDEPFGCQTLLTELSEEMAAEPILEGASIIGLTLPDGSTFTLEMGDAVEYSSAPALTIGDALRLGRQRITHLAHVADRIGIKVLTGGRLPFEDPANIKWAPKPRTEIMRQHFNSLGDGGLLGDHVMGLTLSTQVSLDAEDTADYMSKLHALISVSPFIAALLTNSPSLERTASPEASLRMLYWRQIDPARCQDLTLQLHGSKSFEDLVDALASLSMIYRKAEHGYVAGPPYSFKDCLTKGFEDGSLPSIEDWKSQLGQVWPTVRVRRTLETRLPDGQAWALFDAVPAFFVGLVEDKDARQRALDVVGEASAEELDIITVTAAVRGYAALPEHAKQRARALIQIAEQGLRRVAPEFEFAMDAIQEIAASEHTPAADLSYRWHNEWNQDPARYVAAMAVPVN